MLLLLFDNRHLERPILIAYAECQFHRRRRKLRRASLRQNNILALTMTLDEGDLHLV
jgi:hypothetical protein